MLAAAACGFANAQTTAYTTPVGYETITLSPGQYNLMGVRLFNPKIATGVFDSSTSTSLTDNEAAFTLNSSKSYIIEFSNGATIIASGSNFSATAVSGLSGISSAFVTGYVIREATTVASVFGSMNQSGLASSANADPTEADLVLIPSGSGYIRAFYSTYSEDPAFYGWLNADDFSPIAGQAINPGKGLFVQTAKSTSSINLVVSGEVKTTPTSFVVDSSYSLVGSVYPAGATLASSNLSASVKSSANADPTEADVVLLPNGTGGYVRAFYSTYTEDAAFSGWLNADDFSQIPSQPMTSGFFVQKNGQSFTGTVNPPSTYSGF